MTNKVVRQSSKCANCANNDYQYKMNEIENKFLLVEDKFMLEMHLKQPGFTYSVCGPFTKDKRIIMQTGTGNYIYKNNLDKACFQHDMPYGKYKELTKRVESDKILRDKASKIASNPKYNGYEQGLASMVYKFFSTQVYRPLSDIKSMSNQQLADELHKPIIRKSKRRRVSSSRQYLGIWLSLYVINKEIQKRIRFWLYVIYLFSKYSWVVPIKTKSCLTIVKLFQNVLDSSKGKPNKVCADQGSDNSFKKWLEDNDKEMYSTHNEGKSVVAEKIIRAL